MKRKGKVLMAILMSLAITSAMPMEAVQAGPTIYSNDTGTYGGNYL